MTKKTTTKTAKATTRKTPATAKKRAPKVQPSIKATEASREVVIAEERGALIAEVRETPIAVVAPEIAQAFGMAPLVSAGLAEIKAPYAVDRTKGEHRSELSKQWWSRPADQRFVSVAELGKHVRNRRLRSKEIIIDAGDIEVVDQDMTLRLGDFQVAPTHHTMNQLQDLGANMPIDYLRRLAKENRPDIAQQAIQHSISKIKGSALKALVYTDPSDVEAPGILAALTTPDYGRIWDEEIVGTIEYLLHVDPHWKVPGEMNPSTFIHNPYVETTKENTTLYASDRDVFMFLCKDTQPIEIGKTAKGDADLVFPGFYVYNSEQGNGCAGLATFMLRGVCMNRTLWGVEGFNEVKVRHSKNAPRNFRDRSSEAVRSLHEANPLNFVHLVKDAKAKTLAKSDEDAKALLLGMRYTQRDADAMLQISLREEETGLRTAWDFHTAATAMARQLVNQDRRMVVEQSATKFLQMAA